jgi:hypothetical protein
MMFLVLYKNDPKMIERLLTAEEELALKKRQQSAFRRYLRMEGSGNGIYDYLGLNFMEARTYLENLMQPDMNWGNYGEMWVVDHIVPLHFFDLTKESELRLVWNYQNLLPVYDRDNIYKHGAIHFSLEILLRLERTFVVGKLIERCEAEINRINSLYLSLFDKPAVEMEDSSLQMQQHG